MAELLTLEKGQKVDLTKGNPGLTEIAVGMGWDVNKGRGGDVDLDAFAVCLDENSKAIAGATLYYGSPKNAAGKPHILNEALVHSGDNLTGQGDGDDETISITFSTVPANVKKVVFAANIYEAANRSQNFGMVRNAYIRVYNKATGEELLRYDLTEDASTATGLVLGEVYNHNGEWKFGAVSNPFNGTINDMLAMY
jgi:tellurium resistance protein TerD